MVIKMVYTTVVSLCKKSGINYAKIKHYIDIIIFTTDRLGNL